MKVGIIGAGQLAWMLGEESLQLGTGFNVLTDTRETAICRTLRQQGAEIFTDVKEFCQNSDAISFENEFFDFDQIREFHHKTLPDLDTMTAFSSKLTQKKLCEKYGIPTSKWIPGNLDGLKSFSKECPNFVIKLAKGGYDGRGLFFSHKTSEEKVASIISEQVGNTYLEQQVNLAFEVAIQSFRSKSGKICHLPLVLIEQEDGVCDRVYGPWSAIKDQVLSQVSGDNTQDYAQDYAQDYESIVRTHMEELLKGESFTGVLSAEWFITTDGTILLNEFAPRVHNSGHYSLDAFSDNQFSLHIKSLIDALPSQSNIDSESTAVIYGMKNILAVEGDASRPHSQTAKRYALDTGTLYDYAKGDWRLHRKMGHFNYNLEDWTKKRTKESEVDTAITLWKESTRHPKI